MTNPPVITLEQVITFLLETSMFRALTPGELSEMVRIMQIRRLRDGEVLFREGGPSDGWYVVYDGLVSVGRHDVAGPEREICLLGSHGCFGEMSMLDGGRRSATARARGDSVVFRFPRADFDGLLEEENIAAYKLVHAMARVLSQRSRATNDSLAGVLWADTPELDSLRDRLAPLVDDHTRAQ